MEHKIGEIITLPDGRKAEVVEGFCEDCILNEYSHCWRPLELIEYCCSSYDRSDHESIIYKEIKEK